MVVRVQAREHARDDRARRRTGGKGIAGRQEADGVVLAERVAGSDARGERRRRGGGRVVARPALFRTARVHVHTSIWHIDKAS